MNKIENFFEFGNKKPKFLTILLHGYGAKGENLIALAPNLSQFIKDSYFIAPNAHLKLEAPFEAYQWFELRTTDPRISPKQVVEANNVLDRFIDQQLKRFNLNYSNLILAGFSQGAMMSLYNATRRKEKIAAVVSFSGRFLSPVNFGEKINSKTDICLIHGNEDNVVPFHYLSSAYQELKDLNFEVEAHEIDNLDHSIDYRALSKAQKFLSRITSKDNFSKNLNVAEN